MSRLLTKRRNDEWPDHVICFVCNRLIPVVTAIHGLVCAECEEKAKIVCDQIDLEQYETVVDMTAETMHRRVQ